MGTCNKRAHLIYLDDALKIRVRPDGEISHVSSDVDVWLDYLSGLRKSFKQRFVQLRRVFYRRSNTSNCTQCTRLEKKKSDNYGP